ncbi:MAG: N-6 DNA methylase [Candidatus Nomurabacteria bacterium]|jgi:adenine-specific DNA-methyltransferase|nr:N-6 DNA methylase [Candidatus Nomurabacteria bacterium]
MMGSVKNRGEIFTPDFIVQNILDLLSYKGAKIVQKHIIDNSCGQGAFLTEIVRRYLTQKSSKTDLEKYVHGIELDAGNVQKCRKNLDTVAAEFGIKNVKWDVKCANALDVSEYDGKMDFVVGNPPYVRVHNLATARLAVKSLRFTSGGMTDLYIAFYEIGFKMLNARGKLGYITPSSWLASKSGQKLRQYILASRHLVVAVDLGHFQPFENAMAYTMLTIFDNSKRVDSVRYGIYDCGKRRPRLVSVLNYDDFYIDGKMCFGAHTDLERLRTINDFSRGLLSFRVAVKNGFATLADKIFIGDFDFDEPAVIPVLKASTGRWAKAIFPYDKFGRAFSENKIAKSSPKIYKYLLSEKSALARRSIENESSWYLYGRSQAIKDVCKNKIAVNTIIKDRASLKINDVPAGSGVYGGLYILTDQPEAVKKIIGSDDFIGYVRSLKKYKSGGYYTFSSDDLKKYLKWELAQLNHKEGEFYEQQSVFGLSGGCVPNLS